MIKVTANLKSQSKKTPHSWKHRQKLDRRDAAAWAKHNQNIVAHLLAILDDAKTILPSYGKADWAKDKDVLLSRIRCEGLSFATVTLPNLADSFMSYLETGRSVYIGWKLQPNTEHPRFLRGLFQLMYVTPNEVEGIRALALFYQLCSAFKKIEGPYPTSVLRKQLADFIATDKSLQQIDFESESLGPIVAHARDIVTNIFADFDPHNNDHARPKPGPGATNTKVEKHMRYEPHVLYTQHHDAIDYFEWFYTNPWHLVNEARKVLSLWENRRVSPRSRQLFVHKKVGKARGICIEENESQFLQQAFKRALYEHLETHRLTRGRINFTDQSINQRLALGSSQSRYFATIDMSEASDRVALMLVLRLFSGVPDLKKVLHALSTRFVDFSTAQCDVGVESIEMHKYAPMGSGLCFPVMAVVHFALIQAIIRNSSLQNRMRLSKEVYVYGDDIVIPVSCIRAVYDWLPMFGMKLNEEKSFHASHFRESCGVHAFYGTDVTPVYFQKIIHKHSRIDSLLSIIGKEELFFNKGMFQTAQLLREEATRRFGDLPYVGKTSVALGWIREGRTNLTDFLNQVNPKVRRKRIRSSVTRTLRGCTCRRPQTQIKRAGESARSCWARDSVAYDDNQLEYKIKAVVPLLAEQPKLEDERGYYRSQIEFARDAADVKGSCEELKVRHMWVPESAI